MTPLQVISARTHDRPPEGTPILTPRTGDAQANLMKKFVDRLFSASTDMLTHLALEGEERNDAWKVELKAHKDIFDMYYKRYEESGDFIDIDFVSRKIKAEEFPFWPSMTKAVATANLAQLLGRIHRLEEDEALVLERLPWLENMDGQFPVAFLPGGRQGLDASAPDDEMLRQAFDIRTQRYIETLRGVQNAPPSRLFARVFLNIDGNMDDESINEIIHEARLRAFPGLDVYHPKAQKYREEIDGFRAMIAEEMDVNTIISKLDQKYPFQPFLDRLKKWIKLLEAELTAPTQPLSLLNGDGPYSLEEPSQQDVGSTHIGR
jgi:hypothetical protein